MLIDTTTTLERCYALKTDCLGLNKTDTVEELPEIRIVDLGEDEIAEMRRAQEQERLERAEAA